MPAVTVLMPTFKQEAFITRALDSLINQKYMDWELWIIDDGSPDETATVVAPYLIDDRIHYQAFARNYGLGAALNYGLTLASGQLIAYLPSDDVYYADHLASLVEAMDREPTAVMAFGGIRHHYNRFAAGQIPGYPLQLVQVMHRKTQDHWVERSELVTDDLERMYWVKLKERGAFLGTGTVSCEWVDHPDQRHKRLREPEGGINLYRQYYGAGEPLRYHSSVGNRIDEVERYRQFRERPDTPPAEDGLKILLVGELAYNPERILALEENGHRLYGLWMRDPYWYNTVGPLPFGHVQDLPYPGWEEAVHSLQPDLIYALLNWQAVPFVHSVQKACPDIPFVWHYKEGPFISLEKGHWRQLMDVFLRSHGLVYSSPEMQAWFKTVSPGLTAIPGMVLDGDLPKREWFTDETSQRLSDRDGELHTVVPGRPIGLHPHNVVDLAEVGIHLHFYGDFTHGQWLEWIEKTRRLAPGFIHLHRQVDQDGWVKEFSKYDAGWLHFFQSENRGEIRRANWDDLNYPARIATLVAAGLPLIQRDNSGSIVATQILARQLNIGIFFTEMAELRDQMRNEERMAQIRENVWKNRHLFTFDFHVDRLVSFFREAIAFKNTNSDRRSSILLRREVQPVEISYPKR